MARYKGRLGVMSGDPRPDSSREMARRPPRLSLCVPQQWVAGRHRTSHSRQSTAHNHPIENQLAGNSERAERHTSRALCMHRCACMYIHTYHKNHPGILSFLRLHDEEAVENLGDGKDKSTPKERVVCWQADNGWFENLGIFRGGIRLA
jgi:hypothetical protein